MSFTSKFRDWTDSAKNIILIIVIIGAVAFAALTIAGDSLEDDISENGLPNFPSKAVWLFSVDNSGNVILTKEYSQPTDTTYELHGYWEIINDKYRYKDVNLLLDEKYFGPITVERIKE